MPAYSYHRILQNFGRSVNDKTLECDLDIHPWDIKINNARWTGKIRLVGFVDCFFVIAYSKNARFERGIILYKDSYRILEERFKDIAPRALKELREGQSSEEKEIVNDNSSEYMDNSDDEVGEDMPNTLQSLRSSNASKDSLGGFADSLISNTKLGADSDKPKSKKHKHRHAHFARAIGHVIHLSRKYSKSDVKVYQVEINKPENWPLRRRIERGIQPHSTYQMMGDVVRYGIISQGQLMNHLGKILFAGGAFNETARKYFQALMKDDEASPTST
ncbi:hypothetical protein N7493_010804 [Penicillium malachiteum]|uniref:Uncharacterized protein n=1 Tax=Penicillium malachiteum TaxID=1324776 RepID=A0AAD6HDM2_9EURO|nr:hypothetical protein N7493_010804 [Penicillium malachiteum]